MIPLLLAAAGAYLIGDSFKDKQKFAKGGSLKGEGFEYLSSRNDMFSKDNGITKKQVLEFLNISKNSDKKYWIKDLISGYSYYAYKGQLRANDSTGGIFEATKIGVDRLKDDHEYKINEEELSNFEKESNPDGSKRNGWESIVDKFYDIYFLEDSKKDAYKSNEITSDQVKAEEYLWEFDRYSKYPSTLSWLDAENKFKKSLTKEELSIINISYKKEKFADAEEHDSEKYYKQIIIKKL